MSHRLGPKPHYPVIGMQVFALATALASVPKAVAPLCLPRTFTVAQALCFTESLWTLSLFQCLSYF